MQTITLLLALFLSTPHAQAFEVFNLNVFDQLQGQWEPDFRGKRMASLSNYIKHASPEIVVFQEARANKADDTDSTDSSSLHRLYPHRKYVHEMTGADGASYGYWIGSKTKPDEWILDGFSFPGGVERKVQGVFFRKAADGACLGLLSLHLSYQNSEVRVKEAHWVLDWIKAKQSLCTRWMVVGDFNADKNDPEMKTLFEGGLEPLYTDNKPTVGAFNPIRRIYGENIPSKTIDWALGSNLDAAAEVVLDSPWKGEWVSDHAAVKVKILNKKKK